jgi:hypothetical protein
VNLHAIKADKEGYNEWEQQYRFFKAHDDMLHVLMLIIAVNKSSKLIHSF